LHVVKKKAKTAHKIEDKKKRGEWVELKFMAEAAERNLPACKPLGDSENFDVVVGRPGRFVGVQVKCTVFRAKNGDGYVCSVCSSHSIYKAGAFDFLVAYVVPEEAWYFLPATEIMGMRSVTLMSATSRYEKYREAWELLREAVMGPEAAGVQENKAEEGEVSASIPGTAMARLEVSMNFFRRSAGKGFSGKQSHD
jgi:PD-(D/E)XK endonuclease